MTEASTIDSASAETIRQAVAAAQAGDIRRACAIGEQAIAAGTDTATLRAMVGVFRCRMGDLAGGAEHLRLAHQRHPEDLTVATNLAAALVELRDYSGALEVASDERADADPSLRLARFRGFAAQSLGRAADAIAAYQRIVAQAPGDWEAWNNLGNAMAAAGDQTGALQALREANRINPTSAATTVNLARALVEAGQVEEAEEILRRAVDRDPADAPALKILVTLLKAKRLNFEAVGLLARAVEANPNDSELQLNFGIEAGLIHRPEIAEQAFLRVIEIAPSNGDGYVHLAQLYEQLNREEDFASVRERAAAAGASEGAIAYIHALEHKRAGRFAEGLALLDKVGSTVDVASLEHMRGLFLERLGEYDAAFAAYQRMNEPATVEMAMTNDRGARLRSLIRDHLSTVSTDWMSRWREETPADGRPSPAFIVGFPRSGTTLLDTMLMSHPRVEVMEEEPPIRDATIAMPGLADYPRLTTEQIQAGRDAYFESAAKVTPLEPGSLLVDKNPLAMNSLPLIYRLFPDAKIVLALRHPCDVVLSCFITKFRINSGMANFVQLETAAELYDLSFSLFEQSRQLTPVAVHTLRYEELVSQTAEKLRSVCAFLGLEWTDALLDHQSTARKRGQIKTASYSQVVEPVYTRAAGRWQHYRKHLEPVIPILEPWVRKFGYSL